MSSYKEILEHVLSDPDERNDIAAMFIDHPEYFQAIELLDTSGDTSKDILKRLRDDLSKARASFLVDYGFEL